MENTKNKIVDGDCKQQGITDRDYLMKRIDSKLNFLDNLEITHKFSHSRIEIIKFTFEYCEKVNKKINLDSLYVFEYSSNELRKYLQYLRKHNYSTYKYDSSNENKCFYMLENIYAASKNIKNKDIYCYSSHCINCMYVYNNRIIYYDTTTYIYKLNYIIYLS